ncbi:MAG: N-acetyltransferase, partial [Deltaproteobacteria bacterium]|nr:N-acetyltransferase [Deltaproteobacteria bacterium]
MVTGLEEVDPAAWDALVPADNPFLEHRFLHGLETSGAVGRGTGWQPCHVVVEDEGRVVAAMPLYARGDSYGEYVFDWSWASAAARAGLRYYPKLTTAVPFTPSSTGRVLGDPARLVPAVEMFRRETGASGHHVLFCSAAEAGRLARLGYAPRLGFQFQWRDEGFGDFDGFVGRFNHKRRKELLRERRQVREAGIGVQVLRGND